MQIIGKASKMLDNKHILNLFFVVGFLNIDCFKHLPRAFTLPV